MLARIEGLKVASRTSAFQFRSYASIRASYERALELDPNNANALNWQGITWSYVPAAECAGRLQQAPDDHLALDTDVESLPALTGIQASPARERRGRLLGQDRLSTPVQAARSRGFRVRMRGVRHDR